MSELPEGWVETTFDEVSLINPNMILDDEIEVSFLPMSGVPTNYLGCIQSEPRKWRDVRKGYTPFQNGDTLFAKVTPCFENGKAVAVNGLSNGCGAGSTELFVLRPLGGISPKYLLGLVKTERFLRSGATNMTGSVGLKRVPKDFVLSYSIPLAPLAEQKVIADKLDALLAQVDTLQSRLDALPAILKRFRQSVLSAAVSGKLTEEWRGLQSKKTEWKTVLISEAGKVQLGRQRSPKFHAGNNMRPYLRVQNVYEDRLDLSDVMEMDFPGEDFERYLLHPGDILLNEGQSPEFLGRPAMYQGEIPGACFTNTLIRFQASPNLMPKFALYVFRNYMHSGKFRGEGTITTNIAHLGAGRFGSMDFPLPTKSEQTEIVRRVESLFAFADQIEARVQEATARVKHLTQSILAKAFRGELTEEWRKAHSELVSGENSAAALLERIRAARDRGLSGAEASGNGKRGRKASSAPDSSVLMAAESTAPKKRGRPGKASL